MVLAMEADDREARGRRGLLWFRLTFYPLALAFAALLLLHGRASGDDESVVLVGRTGQGERISVTLDGSRPSALSTRIANTCTTGDRRSFVWWPADGSPVPFRVDGSHLQVEEIHEEAWPGGIRGRLVATLDGTVDDGHARGTLTSSERIVWPDGREMTCHSGPIRFAAGEQDR